MSGIRISTRVFPGPQNLAIFAAEAKGLFADHGVDADIAITVGSDEQRSSLTSGTTQLIHSAVDNAVYMREIDKVDAVIVSGGGNGMNDLVVRPEVRDYEDIRGKTVVVDSPRTAYAFQLYTMLAMNGLSRDDYDVIGAGGATQRLQAMREDPNHVAAMLNPPWNFVARREGFKSFGAAVAAIGPYQADGIFVMRDWAQANEGALVGYIKAMIQGTRWVCDPANRREAQDILAQRLGIDADLAALSVEVAAGPSGGLARDARFDVEGFKNLLAIRERNAGTWKGRVPPWEGFCDFSYYERALHEIDEA